jgi:hypothetical protein
MSAAYKCLSRGKFRTLSVTPLRGFADTCVFRVSSQPGLDALGVDCPPGLPQRKEQSNEKCGNHRAGGREGEFVPAHRFLKR